MTFERLIHISPIASLTPRPDLVTSIPRLATWSQPPWETHRRTVWTSSALFKHTYAINTTRNGSIVIPTSALGNEGTTYIYRDILEPWNTDQCGYGLQGLWMWAYRNPGAQDRKPQFYECPVTVDPVITSSTLRTVSQTAWLAKPSRQLSRKANSSGQI